MALLMPSIGVRDIEAIRRMPLPGERGAGKRVAHRSGRRRIGQAWVHAILAPLGAAAMLAALFVSGLKLGGY